MALKIRLARAGSKKRPYYHVVVADVRSPRDGRFIEKVGAWNPMLAKDDANRVTIDADRIKHWMSHGALPTDRVQKFLADAGLAPKVERNNPNKAKPGKQALERAKAKAAAAEAAAAKAAEAAAAAEAPAEAPAEEAAEA